MAIRNSQDVILVLTQPSPHGDIRNSQDVVLILGQNLSFDTTSTRLNDFTMVSQPLRHIARRAHLLSASPYVPITSGVITAGRRHQFFVIT